MQNKVIDILCKRQSGASLSSEEESIFRDWFIQNQDELTQEIDEQDLIELARYRRETPATWEQFKAKYNPPEKIYLRR